MRLSRPFPSEHNWQHRESRPCAGPMQFDTGQGFEDDTRNFRNTFSSLLPSEEKSSFLFSLASSVFPRSRLLISPRDNFTRHSLVRSDGQREKSPLLLPSFHLLSSRTDTLDRERGFLAVSVPGFWRTCSRLASYIDRVECCDPYQRCARVAPCSSRN